MNNEQTHIQIDEGERKEYTIRTLFNADFFTYVPVKVLANEKLLTLIEEYPDLISIVKTVEGMSILILRTLPESAAPSSQPFLSQGFVIIARRSSSTAIYEPWSLPSISIQIDTKGIEGIRFSWNSEDGILSMSSGGTDYINPGKCNYELLDLTLRGHAKDLKNKVSGNISRIAPLVAKSLGTMRPIAYAPHQGTIAYDLLQKVRQQNRLIEKYRVLLRSQSSMLLRIWIDHFPITSAASKYATAHLRTSHLTAIYLLSCCVKVDPEARLTLRKQLMDEAKTKTNHSQDKMQPLWDDYSMEQLKEIGHQLGVPFLPGDDKESFIYSLLEKL